MIKIENLSFKYKDEVVFESCSASISHGKLVALLGSNGSGKSTLLNCIMAWLTPQVGKVILNGKPVSSMSASERSASIAIVLSRIPSIPMMTVEETLTVGLVNDQRSHEKLTRWMELCGISSFAKRSLDTLSDGQLQRVMIARALVQETPILLMDEPLAHLDHPSKIELMALLKEVKSLGKTILFSTHDIHYLNDHVDNVWLLEGKKIETLPGDYDLSAINWKQ